MKEQTKTVMVEQKQTVYIAEDGTEFNAWYDCYVYERDKKENFTSESAMRIKEADGFAPCDGMENMECWDYKWYKVTSQKGVEELEAIFGDKVEQPVEFPEYINIQTSDDSIWSTTLSATKDYVERFFSKFGITVTFTEE